MKKHLAFLSCIVALGAAVSAVADDYAAARAELVAAYQAEDYDTMVSAAERALAARPGHPGAYFNLALANALNGDARVALEIVGMLLGQGVDFGIEDIEAFDALQESPEWAEYLRRVEILRAPAGIAEVVLQLDGSHFVPEGIAVDTDGNLYLGSIRKGLVVRGNETLSDRQGHWSVFGIRFHEDGSVWFASAAVPQLEDVGEDLGKTGLFRLDTATGEITRAALLPHGEQQQVLGDLIIDGNAIYTTDSLTGAVYRYDIDEDTFSSLLEPGILKSPQGLALDASGTVLFVADYAAGLYRVDIAGRGAERMQAWTGVVDYGIDGLYRHGNRLIAIQNGIRPHRVVSFELQGDGHVLADARVLAANLPEFDEPTLGAVHGDSFYFVANSHWNRFDRENRLPEGLSGPVVLKLELDHEVPLDNSYQNDYSDSP